jgi:membrane associated rhomboid family serine protease
VLVTLSKELSDFFLRSQVYMESWLIVMGGLWLFNLVHWALGSPLFVLGIRPRRFAGLIGILFCPVLHQNFNHLFFNSIPLFVLGLILLTQNVQHFIIMTTLIVVLGGLLVWLLARSARHIGASGLISGYFGYILVLAYFKPDYTSLFLAGLVLYYFGSILLGLFPREAKVSWESHLYGFISGILGGYWITHPLDPIFQGLPAFPWK